MAVTKKIQGQILDLLFLRDIVIFNLEGDSGNFKSFVNF